jgi:hypothetical protein
MALHGYRPQPPLLTEQQVAPALIERAWELPESVQTESSPVVELADRHSLDLDVVLVWARRSGRLWVDVTHIRTGRVARIKATPSNALDVFHHPFAYAA